MPLKGLSLRGFFLVVASLVTLCAGPCYSTQAAVVSQGALVYVPVYSHIYVGIRGDSFDLAISLSVRNIDPNRSITVTSVDYHDSKGKPVRRYIEKPVEVPPLGTTDFFVSEADSTGGFGAAFLVKWKSEVPVNEPIIEGVMAGTRSAQGISFTSRGKTVAPHPE